MKHQTSKLATKALHAGYDPLQPDPNMFRSFVPPLIESAVYPLGDTEKTGKVIQGVEPGYGYGRSDNPTVDVLQKRLAALEGGERSLATPTGMHAVFALLTHLAKMGDEIVVSRMIYGEAYELFFRMAPQRLGITPKLVEHPEDLGDWERQITNKTRFVWVETPSNPTLFISDVEGLAKITKKHGVLLIVDNTLATACLLRPIELGADVVVLSLTKFVSGNGAVLGGAIVGSESLVREIYLRTLGYIGGAMRPFDAWVTLLSIETLPLRMERHSSNAERIASYLHEHSKIVRVDYPSLADTKQRELAKHQMPNGSGGLLSFVIDGGVEEARKVMDSFELISVIPSFGTSRSGATHPATFTHYPLPATVREMIGISDGLVRLSVGLEEVGDLLADLDQALARI